jgi:hypothetical protein
MVMVKVPSYLYRSRYGIYYLRMPGKPRKSLRTRDPKTARLLREIEVASDALITIEKSGSKIEIDFGDPNLELEAAQKLLGSTTGGLTKPPQEENHKLSLLIKDYIFYKRKEKAWTDRTTVENKAIFNLFLDDWVRG